jgi:hypothetical protein
MMRLFTRVESVDAETALARNLRGGLQALKRAGLPLSVRR